jgi:quercetin dioxygenase-like cupin family protein
MIADAIKDVSRRGGVVLDLFGGSGSTLIAAHKTGRRARVCESIKGVLVEYGPGGYSPGHTHPKSAFIYATVLEGAIRSQVNDRPVTTYEAGESFSELPGDRHSVSANASETKPAMLLAVFVVDTNETELTIPLGN